MRIATWYENRLGRNDGNPLYVTACLKRMQYFNDVLHKNVLNEKLLGMFTDMDTTKDKLAESSIKALFEKTGDKEFKIDHIIPWEEEKRKIFGKYDLNVWVDWGEDGLTGLLPYKPDYPPAKPLAYWASDTHLGFDYRLECAKQADYVFVAQKRAVNEFKEKGVPNPIWLPHAFEPLAYPRFALSGKRYDVCFVGHISDESRMDHIDRLFREFPNFFFGKRLFENAAKIYNESKICFNVSTRDDVNMRCFEVMGCGGFLLTNQLPDFDKLGIKDGDTCATYNSMDEMVDKAKFYLNNDSERNRIVENGYNLCISRHTIQHRVDAILNEFANSKNLVTV